MSQLFRGEVKGGGQCKSQRMWWCGKRNDLTRAGNWRLWQTFPKITWVNVIRPAPPCAVMICFLVRGHGGDVSVYWRIKKLRKFSRQIWLVKSWWVLYWCRAAIKAVKVYYLSAVLRYLINNECILYSTTFMWRYNDQIFPKKWKFVKSSKMNTGCVAFLSTSHHLTTTQIYLVTLRRGPSPSLGTTLPILYEVVKTISTSSCYNSKMLLKHWCISINNVIMSYIITEFTGGILLQNFTLDS